MHILILNVSKLRYDKKQSVCLFQGLEFDFEENVHSPGNCDCISGSLPGCDAPSVNSLSGAIIKGWDHNPM